MTIFDSPRIYSLLEQYNPWWKNGQVSEKLPTMHRKAYHDTLRTICSAELRRFAVLSGARRVGKTTVMKQLIVELLSRGVPPSNILYLTFDNPIFKLCGIDRVIQAYEEYVPHQGPYFFFLDEVQYAESCRSGLRPCTICTRTCDWWRPVLQVRLLKRWRLTAA